MMIRSAGDLGRLVKAERLRRNLTQGELASLHGTTQRWISMVESGKDATRLGAALRLLTTLGVELEPRPIHDATKPPSALSGIVTAHGGRRRGG
jgi:transcriptional regulator with XRE-family HTH domain